jgi:chromosome segregation ATPase
MKIHDILREASDDSGDYQQMLAFTRANRVGGVPDEQQIPLALFKELKKQQQQNQALSAELDAAEQRIDQATASGELSKQELGMHRGELDRERAAGDEQKAAVSQLGQQYSEREKASTEQIKQLTGQLEQVRNMPGVDKKAADELEKKIKELGERSVPTDRIAELESTIAQIQNSSIADDAEIQELMAQIEQSQKATKEIEKTKQSLSKDAEQTAAAAMDQVEQMRQDLERLNQVAGRISSVVSDALPAQIDSLNARLQELDSESEHQYDELLKHDTMLNKLTGQGGGVTAEPEPEPEPPIPPAPPAPPPQQPSAGRLAADAIARAQKKKLAQAQGLQIHQLDDLPDEVTAESRFDNAIRWATGKKL